MPSNGLSLPTARRRWQTARHGSPRGSSWCSGRASLPSQTATLPTAWQAANLKGDNEIRPRLPDCQLVKALAG
jgi:hypothetical protein